MQEEQVKLEVFLAELGVQEEGSLGQLGLSGIKIRNDGALVLRLQADSSWTSSLTDAEAVERILPNPMDLLRLEQSICDSLSLPLCLISIEWAEKPAETVWADILKYWRAWLAPELKRSHKHYGLLFLTLQAEAEGSVLRFLLPPQNPDMLTADVLRLMASYCSLRAGLTVTFETGLLDLREVEETLRQAQSASVESYRQNLARQVKQEGAVPNAAMDGLSAPPPDPMKKPRSSYRFAKVEGLLWGRWNPQVPDVKLDSVHAESGIVNFEGQMCSLESRPISNGQRILLKYDVQDMTGAIQCVSFLKPEAAEEVLNIFNKGGYAAFQAEISYDGKYLKDLQAKVLAIREATPPSPRQDTSLEKRIELHCHSMMSAKDAMSEPKKIVRLAAQMGHTAVAITDHGVVQGFPEAFEAARECAKKGQPIRLILGIEGYLLPDLERSGPTRGEPVVYGLHLPRGEQGQLDEKEGKRRVTRFVAFDTETTGLDASKERVIEIGAVRFELNESTGLFEVTERFNRLVNPGRPISQETTKLTGITQEMITSEGVESLVALKEFLDFVGEDICCAHNAMFDLAFLRYEGFRVPEKNDPHLKFNPILVDTLALSRLLWRELDSFKLDVVCAHLNIDLTNHHRASDDAEACGRILARALQREPELGLDELNARAGMLPTEEITSSKRKPNHIILLAKDELGLYHLYRMVSVSHTQYFRKRPRIPRSLLQYWRQGLIVGSACQAGEPFLYVRRVYEEEKGDMARCLSKLKSQDAKRLARFYDYLEIQPLSNNGFLMRRQENPLSEEDLKNLNRLVAAWGREVKRPVVATCDSHYLNEEDGIFRKIMMVNIGYDRNDDQPELYFRTTEEMLREFSYFPEQEAYEYCVTNPNRIAAQVTEDLRPFPDGTFPPLIDSAAEDVTNMTWNTAMKLYGREGKLPEVVSERVKKELHSIIDNGFAIMYYIAHKLVKKSNDDGYIVGSRGSVGSSLVATFCGITEVNPLPPHYRCPHCNYSEFDQTGNYGSGFDLPAKNCPECGTPLHRDGQDIPFETFLGFHGDKQPDIDLNFSGEYQPRAHRYIQEMFGESHTFRAGTIGSYAEKNALALVRTYLEGATTPVTQAQQRRLAQGLIGVKRTTGQHPGGIVVIPKEREIYDFTPIQYPADKTESAMTTTHFDFNAMHDTILKLDVLGHDDPTMLKVLSDMTGVNVTDIPIPDEKVMGLFLSTEPLGIPKGTSEADSATLGLPEMGTFMARGMIKETTPTRFYDLVQLMGLSHGTDVWKGNAQDLIRSGTCTINQVIGCRDSIMTTLIYNGLPPKAAFDIMEKVRKGKGLTEEHETLMREKGVPEWYIESCKKIKYMFPKAHAAAYAISSLRIAWFKVYYPEAYYSAYFTVRADEFDADLLCKGLDKVKAVKPRLYQSFRDPDGKDKDQKLYYIAELVEEMYLRGIEFLPITLYESDPVFFRPEGKGFIRPPLSAIPGLSKAQAQYVAEARKQGPFKSQDDLMTRSGLGRATVQNLAENGYLGDLPASAQMDFFSMMDT